MDENANICKPSKTFDCFKKSPSGRRKMNIIGTLMVILSALCVVLSSQSLCPRLGAESSHLSEAPRRNLSDELPEKLPTFLPKENLNETTAPPTTNETNATIAEELPLPDEQVETPKQPIATFDEWTKEKLRKEQEHRRTEQLVINTPTNAQTTTITDSTANPAAASRNYASRECGAKILHSNPEAENVKAILNDKEKDEYMKNPCERAQNKFFIVELCETIQPLTIELGNFELFSSGPREIRISAAERFPASEWTVLDEAVAQDSRTLQAFQLPKRGIYAKFLRVELLSHYGKEHFCTLTMIRVLGMSMVDEYEAEAEIAAGRLPPAVVAPNVVDIPQQTSSDTAAHEVPVSVVPPVAAQEVVKDPSSDAQQNTKKIVVQPSSDDKSNESLVGNKGYLRKIVDSVLEKFSPDAKKKQAFARLNVFDTCVMCPVTGSADFRTKYFCALLRHQFQKIEDKSSDAPAVERPPRHSRYRESKRRQLQFLRRFHQNSMADFVLTQAIQNDSGQVPTATTDFSQAERPAKAEKIVNELKTKTVEEKEFKDKIVEPIETPTKEQPTAQGQPQQTVQSNTPAQPGKPAEAQQPNQPQQAKQQPAQLNNKPPPTNGQNGKNGNVEPPFADALPGPATSHKETVFMKLNKRIAALELNMSLSSEYLSELSRQYVAQAEMQEKNIERAKRVAEDAAQNAAAYINVTLDEQMKAIRREIAHFSDILAEMRNESHYLHAKLTIYRRPQPDRCHAVFPEYLIPQSASELSRYHYDLGNDEKTWTDVEVAYAVLAVQVFTVIFVVVIQKICAGGPYADEALEPPPGPPPLTIEDVQKLIDERIAALNSNTIAPETKVSHDGEEAPQNPDSKQKKRRRKKNNGKRMKESNIDCHTMSIDADNHTSELEDAEVAGIMSGFAPPLSSTNNTTSGRGSVDDMEYLGAGTPSRCASAPLHSANSPHSRVPDGDLFYYTMAEQRRRQRQLELDASGDALHVTPHYSSHRPITPPNVALGSHRGGFRRPN